MEIEAILNRSKLFHVDVKSMQGICRANSRSKLKKKVMKSDVPNCSSHQELRRADINWAEGNVILYCSAVNALIRTVYLIYSASSQ